jgi:predicted Zn-dependent peptidase
LAGELTRTLSEGRYGGTVRRTVLPGGLRVITEALPAVRSVSFGVWVGIGSRDESPVLAGASHFLEHLLFKGTQRREALEISSAIEAVGGETNAFTAKEYTCYYARVLDADLPMATDVVCDMLTSSLVTPEDVEVERGVILEEISMHDDDPGDVVHDLFNGAVFGGHPLGRPVIGTVETISTMTRDQIYGFYRDHYTPGNLVVAAAGNLDHDQVVEMVAKGFAGQLGAATDPAPRREGGAVPRVAASTVVQPKETEQAHIVFGGRGVHRHDDRRFTLDVLNQALGGGMSSRLFQEIREKRGLAYSVYSYASQYADAGLFGVYAGCAPGRVDEVLGLVREELTAVADAGVAEDEVARGKGMLKGSTVLNLEDTGSRMSRIAKGELLWGEVLEVDDLLGRIDAVSVADVRSVASDLLGQPMSLGVIGPFDDHDFAQDFSEAVAP